MLNTRTVYQNENPQKRKEKQYRDGVEHFAIFEILVFAITSRILIILTEHIETKNSLESELQIDSLYSIRIISI